MRRGFKATAERQAEEIRTDMGLRPADPLDAIELPSHDRRDLSVTPRNPT